MKERNLKIKKLLQLMLDNQDKFELGLCYWIINLYYKGKISYSESNLLSVYIIKNAPFLYKINPFKNGYYWKKGSITPRIKWLKKHIAKL
jgi:hypothetical protein